MRQSDLSPDPRDQADCSLLGVVVGIALLFGANVTAVASEQNLSGWLRAVGAHWKTSALAAALSKQAGADYMAARAAQLQSPFTLSTSFSYNGFLAPPNIDLTNVDSHDFILTNELDFKDRSSFEADIFMTAGAYSYFLSDVNPPDSLDGVSVRLSYDLLRGGRDGLAWSQADAKKFSAQKRQLSEQWDLLNAKLGFHHSATDYFISLCKIRQLKAAQGGVQDLIEAGRVQLKAKILQYKDFLNISGISVNFSARRIREELLAKQGIESLAYYGSGVKALATGLEDAALACNNEITSAVEKARLLTARSADESVDALAKSLPNVKATLADAQSAESSARAAVLISRPSLSPFVSAGLYRLNAANTDPANFPPAYSAGLSVSWNIPGPRGSADEEAARRALEAASFRSEATYSQNSSKLASLVDLIHSDADLLQVLQSAEKNSAQLIAVLDAQRTVGQFDSLNYTQALLGKVDAQDAIYDTWGRLVKNIEELEFYRSSITQ